MDWTASHRSRNGCRRYQPWRLKSETRNRLSWDAYYKKWSHHNSDALRRPQHTHTHTPPKQLLCMDGRTMPAAEQKGYVITYSSHGYSVYSQPIFIVNASWPNKTKHVSSVINNNNRTKRKKKTEYNTNVSVGAANGIRRCVTVSNTNTYTHDAGDMRRPTSTVTITMYDWHWSRWLAWPYTTITIYTIIYIRIMHNVQCECT